jgi:hypothetical protein
MHRHSTVLLAVGVIVHMWVTDEGTLAFTDDPKRIPPRYAEQAQAMELLSLDDYARFTPIKTNEQETK